jgi:hypothetical protein
MVATIEHAYSLQLVSYAKLYGGIKGYTNRRKKEMVRMYGIPRSFFPATLFFLNEQRAIAMPRKTTKKTTSCAKYTCWMLVAKAPGQLDVVLPPLLLLLPPPRLGAMSRGQFPKTSLNGIDHKICVYCFDKGRRKDTKV